MSNSFVENNTEIGSPFDEILGGVEPKNNSPTTEIRTDAEFKVDGSEMQEVRSETGGTEAVRRPLKRKPEIGGQGSQGRCRDFGRYLYI
jgi:hypothetical protein